jgi:hypothetical protein
MVQNQLLTVKGHYFIAINNSICIPLPLKKVCLTVQPRRHLLVFVRVQCDGQQLLACSRRRSIDDRMLPANTALLTLADSFLYRP